MSTKKTKILIVEDEEAIRDMIRFSFVTEQNFITLEASHVAEAIKILSNDLPDIILLDWMLPGKNGVELIKWLKQQPLYRDIPVIMLTAKAEEENKIKGLESGADDYITKPFSPVELIARIKTILRRGPMINPAGIVHFKALSILVDQQQIQIEQKTLDLTPIEYRLLYFFVTHPNRVYSRNQLISLVWGTSTYIDDRTVDVQIRRLRDQLKPYGYEQYIKTVRGAGYQFTASE